MPALLSELQVTEVQFILVQTQGIRGGKPRQELALFVPGGLSMASKFCLFSLGSNVFILGSLSSRHIHWWHYTGPAMDI